MLDTAQVELQDQSALGLLSLEGGAAGSPDGDCQVTDPRGAPVHEAHGIAIQTPAIGALWWRRTPRAARQNLDLTVP